MSQTSIPVISHSRLPACLQSLTKAQQRLVNNQLLNDEESTDAAIVQCFVGLGMTLEQANSAIAFRAECLRTPLLHVFQP